MRELEAEVQALRDEIRAVFESAPEAEISLRALRDDIPPDRQDGERLVRFDDRAWTYREITVLQSRYVQDVMVVPQATSSQQWLGTRDPKLDSGRRWREWRAWMSVTTAPMGDGELSGVVGALLEHLEANGWNLHTHRTGRQWEADREGLGGRWEIRVFSYPLGGNPDAHRLVEITIRSPETTNHG
jgi:hypothetical protein